MKETEVKKAVREGYARVATGGRSCCAPGNSCSGTTSMADSISKRVGYSDEELKSVPEGANLGLGCGNPVALASLKQGEVVLDLGSGAGFDCLLAANTVGKTGRVIGVDMTPEMIDKARENARRGSYRNVEFRLGEIEHLPVADNHVDAIISNCVINLAPDKEQVFKEAFRVLKPGGRLMVSDIVLLKELPDFIKESIDSYVGCLAGAMLKDDYIRTIKAVGFQDVGIVAEDSFDIDLMISDPTAQALIKDLNIPLSELKEIGNVGISLKVHAVKS